MLVGIVVKNSNPYLSEAFLREQEKEAEEYAARLAKLKEMKSRQVELDQLISFEEFLKVTAEEKILRVVPRSEAVPEAIWKRLVKQAYLDGRFNEQK
jgi:DNA-directed RNA polymerase subunit F